MLKYIVYDIDTDAFVNVTIIVRENEENESGRHKNKTREGANV